MNSIIFKICCFLILSLFSFVLKREKRYYFILLLNIVFYSLFSIKYIPILLFIICISYLFAFLVSRKHNKLYLYLGISLVLIGLLIIKYINVELNAFYSLVSTIGLSFYSLEAISYIVDSYRIQNSFENNFFLYAASISFFPLVSSGPIERPKELMKKLKNNIVFDSKKFSDGLFYIISGLFKKFVIANNIAIYTEKAFSNINGYNGLVTLVAVILYSIQIYCDFSGYSEMVLGGTKLIGIDITNNFDFPYFSTSMKSFWRRWHISLSTWLKEYVYIPLGGNKGSKLKISINVIVTFVISGLWHGASINYIIWGLIHGISSIVFNKKMKNTFISTLLVFMIVSFSWVFFRASTIEESLAIIDNIFTNLTITKSSIYSAIILFTDDISAISYSIMIFIMILILFIYEYLNVYSPNRINEKLKNIYLVIIAFSIVMFGSFTSASFIYTGF